MNLTTKTTHRILVALVLTALPMLASCSSPLSVDNPPTATSAPPTTPAPASEATGPTGEDTPAPDSAVDFEVPTGWEETTFDNELPAGVRYERVVTGSTVAGFKTNITVVSQETPAKTTLDNAVKQTLAGIRQQGQDIVTAPKKAGVFDGENGVQSAWSLPAKSDQELLQSQVALSHNGRLYFVTLSGDRTDPDLETTIERVRSSWRWT